MIPKTIIWDITSKCNLRCIHCFNSDRYSSPQFNAGNELTTEECLNAITIIAKAGVPHIHLLGGEPLLKKDLFRILSHAKSQGMCVTINTNGVSLSECCSKKLIELSIDQIVVSLDGATASVNDGLRGKGTFSKIINNIKTLQELRRCHKNKMKIGIAFTIVRQNLSDIARILHLAKSLNLDIIDIMDIYISGRAYESKDNLAYTFEEKCKALENLSLEMRETNYQNLVVQLDVPYSLVEYLNWRYHLSLHFHPRNMWCQAGERIWYMQADGRILPCGMTNNPLYIKDILHKEEYKLEDINIKTITSLEDAENSDFFNSFRAFKLRIKRKPRITCKNCKVNNICLPCPILHYSLDDAPDCSLVFKKKEKFIKETLKKQITLREGTKWQKVGGSIRVWNEKFRKYQSIEKSGVLIWEELIKNPLTVGEVVERVLNFYQTCPSRSEIEEDVVSFIYNLYLSNWIELW